MKLLTLLILLSMSGCPQPGKNNTVVMMGDSITDEWFKIDPAFFQGKEWINKGISGETTRQMLSRFNKDVLTLKPAAVVILAGTNDIAENQGPVTIEQAFNNIRIMAEKAKAANIIVILCSVLPVYDYHWKPGLRPNQKIPALNSMLAQYARGNNIRYIDYYSVMVDERNGLKKELGRDAVHPNLEGYKVMEPLLEKAIKAVVK